MSDRTIAMLIQQQRIELAFEITLAALLLAALTLGSAAVVQALRRRSRHTVTRALVMATLLTIACGAIQHQVRLSHRIARERAIAEDERAARLNPADRADGIQSMRLTAAMAELRRSGHKTGNLAPGTSHPQKFLCVRRH
jgi:hypothetical protein